MTEIKQPGYVQAGWFQTHPTEAPQGELASLHESLKPADIREGWQQEPVFRMRAQAAPLPAVQQGDVEVLLIAAVDEWFAKNTGLGGCSDKDVQELQAIFAAHAPTDSQPALPKITAEDRSFLHYNPNTDDIVKWVQHYASAAIAADRAMRAQAAPAAVAGPVAAWMTPEGDRVVTEATMAGARKDGGAMLSSMRPYTVALVRAAAPTTQAAQPAYPELPDFDAVEQHIYAGCRRFIDRDMLEPIHSLIREAIDADRASRGQAPARATADVFGLQWPGENRINLSTVFDTEAEALEYRDNRCDTPGILVVRLSASAYLAAQTAMCDDKEGGAA